MTDKLRVTITRERNDNVETLLNETFTKDNLDEFKQISNANKIFEIAYNVSMKDFQLKWAIHLMEFINE